MYRSSPSSPAITSADIVLPVPESPANSAVTPMPAAAARRIRHSASTCSRCRARAASSRSCTEHGVGEHQVVPADAPARSRRASRSSPAAFCARAPAGAGRASTGRSSRVAASCAHRTARPICPGPRCRWTGTGAGVAERRWSTAAPRSVGASRGDSAVQRDLAAPRGIPADVAGEQHRDREGRSSPDCVPAEPGGLERPPRGTRAGAGRPARPRSAPRPARRRSRTRAAAPRGPRRGPAPPGPGATRAAAGRGPARRARGLQRGRGGRRAGAGGRGHAGRPAADPRRPAQRPAPAAGRRRSAGAAVTG